jgi:NADH dehydrogenase
MRDEFQTAVPRVVIVGAGFGGLSAARGLRGARAQVTVIDRNNHHLFQPLLYQVATAALSPADISAPIRSVLRKQRNAEVLLGEVTCVDIAARAVQVRGRAGVADRTVPYDYLVLATGAGESYFGHDEWRRFAPGLKSIEDATALRRKILLAFEAAEAALETDPDRARAYLTFVIVGGGPTGVELAGAIAEVARKALVADFRHINPASARILLVEALPHLLAAYPESLSIKAEEKLRRMGVDVLTNTRVEGVDADGVMLNGTHLAARTVVWAAGVQASPAGGWIGAERDRAGRVIVQRDLSIPDHPEIFVIGDTALVREGERSLPGIAPVALQEGRYVAGAIRHRLAAQEVAPFAYFDKGTLATVGRAYAVARIGRLRLSGFIAWVTWLAIHIFYLIGFRNRVLVMFQWAWAYITYQRGARLITHVDAEPQREPTITADGQADTQSSAPRKPLASQA